MPANVLDKPGRKVRLEEISADPPKGMTRETAEKRFVTLGKELFELQEAMYAAKVTSVPLAADPPALFPQILEFPGRAASALTSAAGNRRLPASPR